MPCSPFASCFQPSMLEPEKHHFWWSLGIVTCSRLDGFPSFWVFQTGEVVFSHPFPSQMHRFVLRIFYLINLYIGASSQHFLTWNCARVLPVRSPLNLGQESPRDLSDPFRWTWRLDESFVLSLFGLVALFPTYFWLGAMLILDFVFLVSPFSFQDLVFSLNISKNRRAPSSNDHISGEPR